MYDSFIKDKLIVIILENDFLNNILLKKNKR